MPWQFPRRQSGNGKKSRMSPNTKAQSKLSRATNPTGSPSRWPMMPNDLPRTFPTKSPRKYPQVMKSITYNILSNDRSVPAKPSATNCNKLQDLGKFSQRGSLIQGPSTLQWQPDPPRSNAASPAPPNPTPPAAITLFVKRVNPNYGLTPFLFLAVDDPGLQG